MTLHELWDDLVPPERRWLSLLIFFSLCAHALFFFIFKIIPPAAGSFPKRPAQVTWLTGDSTTNHLIWLDWRDPSAIALPRSPLPTLRPPSSLPELPDRYEVLTNLSDQAGGRILRDTQATLPERARKEMVAGNVKPTEVKVETPPTPAGTQVEFLGTLAGREISLRKELPQPAVSETLRVTVLNIGVTAGGIVEAVMIEETSLDASVDLLAVNNLRQWRFKPRTNKGAEMDWGRAIIYWDYQNKPRPNLPATP